MAIIKTNRIPQKRRHTFKVGYYFEFDESDLEKGLVHFKKVVRQIYRKWAIRLHPDKRKTGCPGNHIINGAGFIRLSKGYNYLMGLKTIPMTYGNFNTIMEVTKGYKTTEDYPEVDFGRCPG